MNKLRGEFSELSACDISETQWNWSKNAATFSRKQFGQIALEGFHKEREQNTDTAVSQKRQWC